MAERRRWEHDELLVAFDLYCRLPFGRLDQRTPEVAALARALGRTPGSVAMKLNNFAALDPVHQARGIVGLSNVSRGDREVWEAFHNDWQAMIEAAEAAQERLGVAPPVSAEPLPEGSTEVERMTRARRGQRFFRAAVLAAYDGRCCITGIPVPELLVASHIRPWASFPEERLNPRNGLCLAATHSAAFDAGYIALGDDARILISRALRERPGPALESCFLQYEGRAATLPTHKFPPDARHLAWHRAKVFRG